MGSDRPLPAAADGTLAPAALVSPRPVRRPPELGRLVPSYAVPSYVMVFPAVQVAGLSKRMIERSPN